MTAARYWPPFLFLGRHTGEFRPVLVAFFLTVAVEDLVAGCSFGGSTHAGKKALERGVLVDRGYRVKRVTRVAKR